ncbi:hypothetical protein M9Y10_029587 [Tritrichomonas musculus]|uniref:Leucine Rich Repeat family protein n=1 Tax=Tritrichomonas musculus TaxID=1915356 RepID=A0ABR2KMS4_9EUKA
MNLKLFLSDSYRRSIDRKLDKLVLNYQVDKKHQENHLKPRIVTPNMKKNTVTSKNTKSSSSLATSNAKKGIIKTLDDKNCAESMEFARTVYFEKCKDLKLKPNSLGEKRFVEQFVNSIHEKSLQLSGLGVGPNCMSILINLIATNPNFVVIDLSLNRIGDKGIEVLCRYIIQDAPFIYLDLRSNGIGIQGSTSLFNSLCMNTHITSLDFSTINGIERNRIGTEACLALANFLRKNQTIASLNLAMCGITAEGCRALGMSLPLNTSLTHLDLTANRFGTLGSDYLFSQKNSFACLTTLILSRNALDDEASDAICAQVETSKTIRNLNLSYNNLGKHFLNTLYDALMNGQSSLESLNLSANHFDHDAIKSLHLIVRDFTIKHFDFSYNILTTKVISDIVNAAEKNESLTSLDLTETHLNDQGAQSIAQMIETHPNLQRLILAQNKITDEGGYPIATALAQNTSLSHLSLSDNELKDKTADAILTSLRTNKTIADIDVSYNDFSCMSYVLLKRMIEEHKRTLNSNVHEIVEKHIEYLKGEEQKLFDCRNEIKLKEENIIEANDTFEQRKIDLVDLTQTKTAEIDQAEIDLKNIKEKYLEVTELQREKSRLHTILKKDLEQKQRDATDELQKLQIKRQQLQSRRDRCELKKVEQATNAQKQIDDLKFKLSEAREQLKMAIYDAKEKKKQAILEESLEKQESKNDDEKKVDKNRKSPKTKKNKKEKKKKIDKEPSKSGDDQIGLEKVGDTSEAESVMSSTAAATIANALSAMESARSALQSKVSVSSFVSQVDAIAENGEESADLSSIDEK